MAPNRWKTTQRNFFGCKINLVLTFYKAAKAAFHFHIFLLINFSNTQPDLAAVIILYLPDMFILKEIIRSILPLSLGALLSSLLCRNIYSVKVKLVKSLSLSLPASTSVKLKSLTSCLPSIHASYHILWKDNHVLNLYQILLPPIGALLSSLLYKKIHSEMVKLVKSPSIILLAFTSVKLSG